MSMVLSHSLIGTADMENSITKKLSSNATMSVKMSIQAVLENSFEPLSAIQVLACASFSVSDFVFGGINFVDFR